MGRFGFTLEPVYGGSQSLGQLAAPEADLWPARLAGAGISIFSKAPHIPRQNPLVTLWFDTDSRLV